MSEPIYSALFSPSICQRRGAMLRLCLPSAGHWLAPSPLSLSLSATGTATGTATAGPLGNAGALILIKSASRLPQVQQRDRPTKFCCCRFSSSITRRRSEYSFSSCPAPSTYSTAHIQRPVSRLSQDPTCMLATALRNRRLSLPSSAMASAFSTYRGSGDQSKYTLTALGRWSCVNKQLPGICALHTVGVYRC